MAKDFSEGEKAYRRGFDQGFYFALHWIGLSNADVQVMDYKRKLGNWRHARGAFSKKDFLLPPVPTKTQRELLRYFVARELMREELEKLGAQNNN